MPTWTTAFSTPPALTTLTATPDPDASAITLAWDATTLSADEFWRYRVFRIDPETLLPVLIGEVDDVATLTFTDQEAPHRVAVGYLVTVTNGWDESDPITATATLELDYWIVDPTDPSLVFPVPHVNAYDGSWDPQAETFVPLDRGAPIVVTGELLPPAGHVGALVLREEGAVFPLVRRAATRDPWVVFKDPFGSVRHVKLTRVTEDRGEAGIRSIGFDYVSVG